MSFSNLHNKPPDSYLISEVVSSLTDIFHPAGYTAIEANKTHKNLLLLLHLLLTHSIDGYSKPALLG